MASPGISCASRSQWPPCLHPHLLPRTWRSGMLCLCSPQDVGCARAAPAPCTAANCREVWMNYSFRLLCRLGAYLGCSLFGRELEMVGETERDSIAGCCPSWSISLVARARTRVSSSSMSADTQTHPEPGQINSPRTHTQLQDSQLGFCLTTFKCLLNRDCCYWWQNILAGYFYWQGKAAL